MRRNHRMFEVRRHLGLTLRDVVAQTAEIARNRRNRLFRVSLRKLSEMEKHSRPPTIHQACTLALLYNVPICEVLSWYLGSVVEQTHARLRGGRPADADYANQSGRAPEGRD